MFRITPNKDEKLFLKKNRIFLEPILSRWIWEMKSDILRMPSDTMADREERDRAISTMRFIEAILKQINIVISEPKESNTNCI